MNETLSNLLSILNKSWPLITLVIGAFLTYFVTKRQETIRDIRNTKTKIYQEFIELQTKWDNNIFSNENEKIIIEAKFEELERKLVLYANEDVINNLSIINIKCFEYVIAKSNEYREKNGKSATTQNIDVFYRQFYTKDENRKLYINLIKSMRKDIGSKIKKLKDEDFYNALEYFTIKERVSIIIKNFNSRTKK